MPGHLPLSEAPPAPRAQGTHTGVQQAMLSRPSSEKQWSSRSSGRLLRSGPDLARIVTTHDSRSCSTTCCCLV